MTIGDLKGIYIVKTRFFSTPDSEHILRITMNSNHSGSSRRSFSRGHRQRMYSHNSHNNLHSHNDNYQHRNYGQWYKEPDPCYSHRYTLVSFIMCTSSFFFFYCSHHPFLVLDLVNRNDETATVFRRIVAIQMVHRLWKDIRYGSIAIFSAFICLIGFLFVCFVAAHRIPTELQQSKF